MVDLLKNFAKLEKNIVQYLKDRKAYYSKSKCKKELDAYIKRLDCSWNMEVPGPQGNQFLGQLNYSLVKEVMLSKRALFTGNYRQDPIFTLTGIGFTPDENTANMQDLIERNNQLTKFRAEFLVPNINNMIRWGVGIGFTEYDGTPEYGYRTLPDELQISKREYGIVKRDDVIKTHNIDVRNYGQNPDVVDSKKSDFRYHIERWTLAELEGKRMLKRLSSITRTSTFQKIKIM